MKNNIVLVNENDNEIWLGEKMDVHKKWLLHRAISVIVFNPKWEILLQQRALWKYHCPWIRSNTTCTHPYPWESCLQSAHRRLQEEMWFDCELQEIFSFQYTAHFNNWLIENEIDHVFKWIYDWDIKVNPEEANDFKRINVDELKKDISNNSEKYSPWFKIICEKMF